MIKEITVHPKAKNHKARIAFLICILISAICFVTSALIAKYKGVVAFAGAGAFVSAMLFYTKYISVEFYYDIAFDSEGTPIFVVRQLIGKRQTTLCRLDLSSIVRIEYETAKERKVHKTEFGFVKYVYAPTLFPAESYRITARSRYEKCEIIIECSKEFSELLLSYSEEARALLPEEEE